MPKTTTAERMRRDRGAAGGGAARGAVRLATSPWRWQVGARHQLPGVATRGLAFAGLVIAGLMTGAAPLRGEGPCNGPLVVAYGNWVPFEFTGPEGLDGINVSLHQALSEITGCATEWREMPWSRALFQIRKGKVDVVNTARPTVARRSYARFSAPYLRYRAVLFLRAKDIRQFDSLSGFLAAGNSLAVVRGYSYGKTVDTIIGKPAFADQVIQRYSASNSLRNLVVGRVDGTIGNPYILGYIARREGLEAEILQTETVVQDNPAHLMFAKASVPERVVQDYSKAIARLKREGRIRRILDRYKVQGDTQTRP